MQLSFGILISLVIALAAAQDPKPVVLGFSQFLNGIAREKCNGANFASCQSSIVSTVSSILSVSPSNVRSVEFGSVSYFNIDAQLNVNRTKLSYVVAIQNSTVPFADLVNTLLTAIDDGSFTTTMQTFGTSGSNALATATAPNSGLRVDNKLEVSSSSDLTGAMIAGIVIGIVLFLVLLGLSIAFALQHKKSEKEYIAANTNTNTKPAKPVSTVEIA